jgi:hypothetical protein
MKRVRVNSPKSKKYTNYLKTSWIVPTSGHNVKINSIIVLDPTPNEVRT